ncbi:non-homologous end-joining DNA ligase [Piscinibacter sakaiensis]|uniref:non-homologous end-joining DNA ligase n=1 Tax=Piscinibacter sakaiensis TaxID=1547922 RepID=UPI003726411F
MTDWLVPQLKGRACALVRGPAGVGGSLFFQKHLDRARIDGVREHPAAPGSDEAGPIEVANARAVAACAQMNVIEFHTGNGRLDRDGRPDRMVFDLDPGEGLPWPRLQEGALLVRELLQTLGLKAWLKTSGGKGLHLVVPLLPRHGVADVRAFSQAVVEHLARVIPQRFVARSGPANRVGRIFVDALRNGPGATTVAAYSARARPGLGVSMPVAWEALPSLRGGDHWTVATAREHLSFQREDPWADLPRSRQTLARAAQRLGVALED